MILEIVPLYSHKFYSTLLIIKELDTAPNKVCKLIDSLQNDNKEEFNEDAVSTNCETSNNQRDSTYKKSYNYDYINNKKDFYTNKKDKNIYILINCGWDDQFCTDDIKNVLRVCEYIDILLITNHSLSFVGCVPLVFMELLKRKRKIEIICHEYVKAYSKYVLLSYLKCMKSCEFFKSINGYEYFKIINDLYQNIIAVEYREYYIFKKIICKKKNLICVLPLYLINNGDNIGSSAIIIKFHNSKILYSVNLNISDYSFIEKSDVIKQSNVFTYISNFRYSNKNYTKMIDINNILNIINRTMHNLGCLLLPVDIDSVFLDLLFHINALIEVSMQRYALLFLCPYAENFTRLLSASLTYMNVHIKKNFHKNRINVLKIRNLVCIRNYKDFKKYENGYYILFTFPASMNNDTVKRILSTFLTRKKNVIIFTKRNYENSFSHNLCNYFFMNKGRNEKSYFTFSYNHNVKIDDKKLYEIYVKEKTNIEKNAIQNKKVDKKIKRKKKIPPKKKQLNFIFESKEEMLYLKKENNLVLKKGKNKFNKEKGALQKSNQHEHSLLLKKEIYKQENRSFNSDLKTNNFYTIKEEQCAREEDKVVNTDPTDVVRKEKDSENDGHHNNHDGGGGGTDDPHSPHYDPDEEEEEEENDDDDGEEEENEDDVEEENEDDVEDELRDEGESNSSNNECHKSDNNSEGLSTKRDKHHLYNAYDHIKYEHRNENGSENEGGGKRADIVNYKNVDEFYDFDDISSSEESNMKENKSKIENGNKNIYDEEDQSGYSKSNIDGEYLQEEIEEQGNMRYGKMYTKRWKKRNNNNVFFKNEHSDCSDNSVDYSYLNKAHNFDKFENANKNRKKKVRIKTEPMEDDDDADAGDDNEMRYSDAEQSLNHPILKYREGKNVKMGIKNEIYTKEDTEKFPPYDEKKGGAVNDESSSQDEKKRRYQTVHISDYYEFKKKKIHAPNSGKKGKESIIFDNTYEEKKRLFEDKKKKMTWKKKLIDYLKIIPSNLQEQQVSISVDCSIKTFNIENYINQNILKNIIHLMKPKNFVLLPSCNSFFSFNFELLLNSSTESMDEIKFYTFYSPNFSHNMSQQNIYLNRYLYSSAKSIDSVNIPLNLHYENVHIKSIYTLLNATKKNAHHKFHIFKIKSNLPSKRECPNSQSCGSTRRKRFINEHSTFWSEFNDAHYSMSIDKENDELKEMEKETKEENEKVQDDENMLNEKNQNVNKEKSNEKRPFLNYYNMDDEFSNGKQGEEDEQELSETLEELEISSDMDDYISNDDNLYEDNKLSGNIYIGDVSMQNLSSIINNVFQRRLNFVPQGNQIIIDGKTCIKKEEQEIETSGSIQKQKNMNKKNNVVWKIESPLDPSFYFLRNVLKDMFNHVSI
ncbi:hypothetical protein, conserved [Plasmodium gonderi]|uniref:Cleavage and polyadenylation specificity factor subunit 2 n=1 Tax=Plasmodium gonderi TaxID=77519 RepID=A0A1Y1JEG2_PLAGO|nr:hypothetical protein, conserved [Plasmodium gonderi]GAW79715.1 hypothetical protein, conserved [Plasmodium gonderi]